MASLWSLILHNPHLCIQNVEVVTIKESSLNPYSSSPLIEAGVDEILVESRDLWYKQLYEYLKWNSLPPDMSLSDKNTFIYHSTWYMILGDVLNK